ncbi:hypothetical protein HanIR_Chr09g0445171 [Helianthus annuus]|nr:hypothetical protein HanIR_Chr09g0445171 [Helianthus annuus]
MGYYYVLNSPAFNIFNITYAIHFRLAVRLHPAVVFYPYFPQLDIDPFEPYCLVQLETTMVHTW